MQRQTDEDRLREREKRVRNARLFLRWWPAVFTAWLASLNLMAVCVFRYRDATSVSLLLICFFAYCMLQGWRLESRRVAERPLEAPGAGKVAWLLGTFATLFSLGLGDAVEGGNVPKSILFVALVGCSGTACFAAYRHAVHEEGAGAVSG